ncbi:unnamed protein product [Hermetia illucens]|uniref:Uncharacterized protein n=1 Tax=Hermetia illucens TaxID=343691 RepID=A0A7R8YXU2_HERIL|nr:probable salivary secreted peptide [Hermetia illucens]CAD7086115.1 unnamed protein product [Hermetia illucens]
MKHLPIVVLAILSVFVYNTSARNFTWGNPSPFDSILDRAIVIKKSKWNRVVTEHCYYPKEGLYNSWTITGIRVTDQYTNGKGGLAILLWGGPGYKKAKILLKSRMGHGFHFIIEIYGYRDFE